MKRNELLEKLAYVNSLIKKYEEQKETSDGLLNINLILISLYKKRDTLSDLICSLDDEKEKDLGASYSQAKQLFDCAKDCQQSRGTITNAWLISLILNDEKQYLTESDKVALKRLLHRIEKEHSKSGL